MKRASWYWVILVLLVSLALVAGCTREKSSVRSSQAVQVGVATATLVLVAPTVPIGNDVLPTLTPTLRATRIAVPPTPTPEGGFAELIAPTPMPTPTEVATPAVAVAEASPPPTPVPVLTPQLETFPLQPIDLASPTPNFAPSTSIPPAPAGTIYTVRWGDTLFSIAAQFGVTVEAIKSANGLSSDIIQVGQQLVIPGASVPSAPAPAPGGGTTTHIVQPGETLFRIALRYNSTVEAIVQANGISNPWFIYPGQQLTVPLGPTGSVPLLPRRTYVVQPGDTLSAIALRFNTTVETLMVLNNLSNANLLHPGQVLQLPE
ncbi:MAG: LysM peptidoglycan-binding domain-containing protein [Anaerolineae bacterium]